VATLAALQHLARVLDAEARAPGGVAGGFEGVATAFSMAAFWVVPVSLASPVTVKTTLAEAPSAPPPNFSSRTSIAREDSVPGIENASLVGPDRVAAPTPNRASTTTHSSPTNLRRRNENRPSRYSKVAT
jgi:hypothetical protein